MNKLNPKCPIRWKYSDLKRLSINEYGCVDNCDMYTGNPDTPCQLMSMEIGQYFRDVVFPAFLERIHEADEIDG